MLIRETLFMIRLPTGKCVPHFLLPRKIETSATTKENCVLYELFAYETTKI